MTGRICITGVVGRLEVGPLTECVGHDGQPRWGATRRLLFKAKGGRAVEWRSAYEHDNGALVMLREVEDPALLAEVREAQARVASAREALRDALDAEQSTLAGVAARCRPARVTP